MVAAEVLFTAFVSKSRFFEGYLAANAKASSFVLRLVGFETTSTGVVLAGDGTLLEIRRGCDALQPAMLFAAAVLCFPVPFRERLRGLPLGICIILLANVVRIASLFILHRRLPEQFEIAHMTIWPALFMLLVLGLWLLWARRFLAAPRVPLASS